MWDLEFRKKLKDFYSLSDNIELRASGRTTILAETLLNIAIENPRTSIRYDIDHFVDARGKTQSSEEVLRRVHQVVGILNSKQGVEIAIEIDRKTKTFEAFTHSRNIGSVFPIFELQTRLNQQSFNNQLLLLLL